MKGLKLTIFTLLFSASIGIAQKKENKKEEPKKDTLKESGTYGALKFRSIGSAVTSGRVIDLAVNPNNRSQYYIATPGGGVWKTNNAGVTYSSVFDNEGSSSIGCITIDPTNSNTIWVGTGENNNQRSVAYGDGIYKSDDAGKSWKNMGLKNSEHIGKIVVDSRNPNIVYVAAYGPLWSAGGDRGIYKTTDGGKTWKNCLSISENTGCNEVYIDPRNSDVLYACAHQRRRHVFTYISGGPESAIYKSTDAGNTWNKLSNGLPQGDVGRIGLAVSPANPDIVYAIIEANEEGKGVYKSVDRGASWEKQNPWSTAGNYYQEIFADPINPNKLYAMDFAIMVSSDGGKSFAPIGERSKHVDNHAFYVDPKDPNYMLAGCDGGVYETFDAAKNWAFKSNLPITQYYRVDVDNSLPFYNVYGGTQDNNSMGGPSRTISSSGILNSDWFITCGGDGFESQIDPKEPNIVYSESQYAGLVRFDRASGEIVDIRPVEKEGEPAYRWNWDAPLAISKHNNKRIYICANKVFKSNDRGNDWEVISPDLTRQVDRNKIPVMGKVWSMDAVAKNQSTSIYGNIVSFYESAKDENLLVVGTDDGLIQITKDGGKTWNKTEAFAGIPDRTYVSALLASEHNNNVLFACFDNHQNGDFKPYVMKSEDGGATWKSIQNNLPAKGTVYCIAQDHKNSNLLFVGTESGVFFSIDGGGSWTQLKGGLPNVCVRDIAIQKRENDLVIATFGRGFYILDDYSPLQTLKKENFSQKAFMFPIKDGLMFMESQPYGHTGKSFQGESFYTAPNPAVGVTFTYFIKDDYKSLKQIRKEKEGEQIKKGEAVSYPSFDAMRAEDNEDAPSLLFTIASKDGEVIRRIKTGVGSGLNKLTWNFRYATTNPVTYPAPDLSNPYASPDEGNWALPGSYTVSISKIHNGVVEQLLAPQAFNIVSLHNATLAAEDKKALLDFQLKVGDLRRAVAGTDSYRGEITAAIGYIKTAILNAPKSNLDLLKKVNELQQKLNAVNVKINGDQSVARHEFETAPAIYGRVEGIIYSSYNASCAPTELSKQSYTTASKQLVSVIADLKGVTEEVKQLEKQLDMINAPYSPGRLPEWNGN